MIDPRFRLVLLKILRNAVPLAGLIILLPTVAAAATTAIPVLSGGSLAAAVFLILWGPICEVLALIYPDPKVNSVIQAIDKVVRLFLPKK